MGELMRGFDWASSPVGPPVLWPQSLRLTIRLMLNSQHPMFIWWGPDLIQFYNDAYRQTMGPEMHPAALGARGRESWADIWSIIGPQIELVMEGKGSTWNVEQLVPIHRHGRREDVWWTYGYSPIDVDNNVGGVLVVCTDVTQQHLMTEALRDRTQRLAQQFEQAPGFIATLRGSDHVFELTNAAYRQLVGSNRDLIGKSVRAAVPEAAGQGFFDLLDQVYQTGVPFVGRRTPITLQPDPDLPPKNSFIDFVYQPVVEADGEITGIFVEGSDVTDHVLAEQRLDLINRELQHRVKNTLAMVSAVASQTFRSGVTDEAVNVFHDRLKAFGSAHEILDVNNESLAPIHQVIETALVPHRTGTGRYWISGPRLSIGPKQIISLAMAIHELATNAAKYGALSNDTGKVEVDWWVSPDDTFHLVWREKGGPPVLAPTRTGFGSRLIKGVLAGDFGGTVEAAYDPDGLSLELKAPISNLATS